MIPLNRNSAEAKAVRKMAKAQGIRDAELIHGWVREIAGRRDQTNGVWQGPEATISIKSINHSVFL
jgi:hypothetical protein